MSKCGGFKDESCKAFSPTELFQVDRRDIKFCFCSFPLSIPYGELSHKQRKHSIEPSQVGLFKETKTIRQTSSLVHIIFSFSGVFTYQKILVYPVEVKYLFSF